MTKKLENKLIDKLNMLDSDYFNMDDGIGHYKRDNLEVTNCIVDLLNVDKNDQDEAISVTYGGSATFINCVFKHAGKLCLIGSGDEFKRGVEKNKIVVFKYCLFENFGRRGPEVQSGMHCYLDHCVIRNWSIPLQFNVRSFGAWAHNGGTIEATNCVFINSNFLNFKQKVQDRIYHISQAVLDNGIKALFDKKTYIAGWRRGLTQSDTGRVQASKCYASKGVILENCVSTMSGIDKDNLIRVIEDIYIANIVRTQRNKLELAANEGK